MIATTCGCSLQPNRSDCLTSKPNLWGIRLGVRHVASCARRTHVPLCFFKSHVRVYVCWRARWIFQQLTQRRKRKYEVLLLWLNDNESTASRWPGARQRRCHQSSRPLRSIFTSRRLIMFSPCAPVLLLLVAFSIRCESIPVNTEGAGTESQNG